MRAWMYHSGKDFGAAGGAQGVAVTQGGDGQQGGSETRGAGTSSAGERVLSDRLRDGAVSTGTLTHRGIGA
jgi:hypothetical protein